MAKGFNNISELDQIVGWELSEVTINKYHIMFWFDDHLSLLNIADRFSYKSADGTICYTYEIYGLAKSLNVYNILYVPINMVTAVSHRQLDILFENRDILTVHDHPEYKSWWFRRYSSDRADVIWEFSDDG